LEASITKPALSVIDENLERFDPLKYHLIIALSQNSAAFGLMDMKHQTYVAIEQIDFMNNQSIVNSFDLFLNYFKHSSFASIKYQKTSALVFSELFTLIPQALFREDAASDFLKLNSSFDFDAPVISKAINSIESQLVYAIPTSLKQSLENTFGEVGIMHQAEPLIIENMTQFKNSNEKILIAHIQNGHFELMAIANHKMIYFNTFKYISTEDVAYYTLLVCETLKLNPEEIFFKLCGEIEKKSAIYALLYKYIRHIEFLSSHRTFKYSGGYSTLPLHFFYSLINSAHCVS
jgi:hypothetical protein